VLDDPLELRCPVDITRQHTAELVELRQAQLVGRPAAHGVSERLALRRVPAHAVGPDPRPDLLRQRPPGQQERVVPPPEDVTGEGQMQPGVLMMAGQLGADFAGGHSVLGDEDHVLALCCLNVVHVRH
jgi:hypothetical protein